MTSPARAVKLPLAAVTLAVAAIASLSPAPASAADAYDVDCKLILCLPAGFPSGCRDAYRHMVDRLHHGKSPIGFCALSDGSEYKAYDIDYEVLRATSRDGWECPPGKMLYHDVQMRDRMPTTVVNTFCFDTVYTYGNGHSQRFTNKTQPERVDFKANLTIEPGTPGRYSAGWQRFNAGMVNDRSTQINFTE